HGSNLFHQSKQASLFSKKRFKPAVSTIDFPSTQMVSAYGTEALVPHNHILRQIDRVLDFSAIHALPGGRGPRL
ncbi:hypothetical protein, partial [Hydrogenibacillus schlegelii]|uniref:hypothetical protein n=1 Tax=Hydrogenibacillus schlegelii TaxID=1484 RepID=UPI0034A05FEE